MDIETQKPRRRWIFWLVLLSLIIGGYFIFHKSPDGAGHGKGKKSEQAFPVAAAPAVYKDIPVYLNGLGTIQAYNTVTVHSQIDGQLIAVLFTEGQMVKAGDVLAKIDPRTYQAQLGQAVANKAKDEATLENARRDLTRYINLGKSISAQTLDTERATVKQLEATVKSDQAAVDNARTLLSYTVIASPISGKTGIRQVDMGNIVHPTDTNGLVVVTQLQPISVIFSLPQQNLEEINKQLALQQGKLDVYAMSADNKTALDKGVLQLVDNQIDQNTGTIRLKATFPNPHNMLWPGGFVNIWLLLSIQKSCLTVPAPAIQRGPQNSYVFVLKDDNMVEMRTVKTGMAAADDMVILSGLNAGEQVVTDGVSKLQDGSKVTTGTDKTADISPGKKEGKKHRGDK